MIPTANIDRVIQRGVKLRLIRLDGILPNRHDGKYGSMLHRIAELLERLQHGATMRRMMYEYAEVASAPLLSQIADHEEHLRKMNGKPSRFDEDQLRGLHALRGSYSAMKSELQKANLDGSVLDRQKDDIHNPNILVNCDSGTTGELGCKPHHIRVYQAIYAASYGDNDFKDVYRGVDGKIVIHPAGRKCNVSIGNPFRMVGWYFNYTIQGSQAAVIRSWEIPAKYFIKLLSYAGTEAQIKDMKDFYKQQKKINKQFHVELCDHRATNQFGLWTHDENGQVNEFGKEFMSNCSDLVTWYWHGGKHRPDWRDGKCLDMRGLLKHLAIPTDVHDRFHNLGTSLSDSQGNLTMNAEVAKSDQMLLGVFDLLAGDPSAVATKIDQLDEERVRLMCNLILYNGMSPQRFNKGTSYTTTGLDIKNLQAESRFMLKVHQSTAWHMSLRKVLELIDSSLRTANLAMPKDCETSLGALFPGCKTYQSALAALRGRLGSGDTKSSNATFIEGLNILLRFLCSGGGFKETFKPTATKGKDGPETFRFQPLSDLRFEIGASHRSNSNAMHFKVDSLDKHRLPGFTPQKEFDQRLSPSTLTSNTRFQLHQHDPVVSRLNEAGVPVMGGVSGTTRDIFRFFGQILIGPVFWDFFSVVAAFMIKNHYHSLGECFIAAIQFYDREQLLFLPAYTGRKLDATKLYNVICIRTRIDFTG